MKLLGENNRLKSAFLPILLCFTFQGANLEVLVSPSGSSLVNVLSGSNVTLNVSLSGATDPAVTWFKGQLPVGTWTINSISPPDIAPSSLDVLRIEKDGSLTFINVPLSFTGNYTVEMTKPGLGKASTTFTLKIFEVIQNLTLSTQPDLVAEGFDQVTLNYSMLHGVVEQQVWYFNGKELKTSSHYSIEETRLVIFRPNRSDTGRYEVSLINPFSRVTAHMDVTVFYGPEETIVETHPAQPFYVVGDSLSLSCQAKGVPRPTSRWVFGGVILSDSIEGVLNLTHLQLSQGGVYNCTLLNVVTKEKQEKSVTINVYEKPSGSPECSVLSVNNTDLQYRCGWTGGTPQAQLSFPALSNSSNGRENFSLTVTAFSYLNKKTIICMAEHPVEQKTCNVTASSPSEFLPAVRTTVDPDGKIAVTIQCSSEASPRAVVSWSGGNEAVTAGTAYQISSDTTQLKIRHYNISNIIFQNYSCTCRNPLGSHSRETRLVGPSISDSSLFPNQDGTIITLTWEVPPRSVVTGFDVQMKGPDLLRTNGSSIPTKGSPNVYRIIQQKPGSARSADIFRLDPKLTYKFRIIPKARMTEGEPSKVLITGPGNGLSGPAIAGIAAGIPCSILFLLLLLCGLIYTIVYYKKKKSHQARYPISIGVEKARASQPDITPHNLLPKGLKSLPDYNRLHQTPSERSVTLPTFVPPPPVRVATTV